MPTFFTDSGSLRNLQVTGSTRMSGSGIVLQLVGSGSTIFSISGSGGEIFKIADDASTTSLFTVSTGSIAVLDIDSSKNVKVSGSLVVTGSVLVNGLSPAFVTKKQNITLTSGSWVSASLYEYLYTDNDIASSSSIVDFTPNTASIATVVNAVIYPTVVVTAGSASFYAENQPANNITGELVITNI
jgi:hypothetical protein